MGRQLSKGEAAEKQLDSHFSDRFQITKATREEQRCGIDRIFAKRMPVASATMRKYAVEYKTDWTAGRTGNAFIETVSVDTMNIPGWVYTSRAEWLIYFVPIHSKVYIIRLNEMRKVVDEWVEQFGPEKTVPNEGYFTRGVPVPLSIVANLAVKIEQL